LSTSTPTKITNPRKSGKLSSFFRYPEKAPFLLKVNDNISVDERLNN
jgi:hypothetical protein